MGRTCLELDEVYGVDIVLPTEMEIKNHSFSFAFHYNGVSSHHDFLEGFLMRQKVM